MNIITSISLHGSKAMESAVVMDIWMIQRENMEMPSEGSSFSAWGNSHLCIFADS